MNTASQIIRRVEREILDQHYKCYDLLKQSRRLAVSFLLKTFGAIHREMTDPIFASYDDVTLRAGLKNWGMALDHALRWTLLSCPDDENETPAFEVLDKQAFDLLCWGFHYSRIFVDHVAWSRGLMDAKCNVATKTITFDIPSIRADPVYVVSQATSEWFVSMERLKDTPQSAIDSVYKQWRKSVNLIPPVLLPHVEVDVSTASFAIVKSWADRIIFNELSESHVLGGYTLGDFRQFFASLYIVCGCMSKLEDECDQQIGRANPLGSPIIQYEFDEMYAFLAGISRLDKSIISSILADITFEPNSFRSSTSTQPFVRTGTTISLLARLFAITDPLRVLSTGLLRKEKRKYYESFVETVEKHNVDLIASTLNEAGYRVIRRRSFKDESGTLLSPDILFTLPSENALGIVDYKHALPPLNPAEVDDKIREMDKWFSQIRKYRCLEDDDRIKHEINCGKPFSKSYLMLLLRWPIVVPMTLPDDIIIGDWETLRFNLEENRDIRLEELAIYYKTLRHPAGPKAPWKIGHTNIIVGEWTYLHPNYIIDPAEQAVQRNKSS